MLYPLKENNRGSALIYTMVIIAILSIIGTTFVRTITFELHNTAWRSHRLQAFYLAEAAGDKSLNLIKEGIIENFPYSENEDFVALGNGQYDLEVDFESGQSGAYTRETYTITGIGKVGNIMRGIETAYQQDTFLRFSRFVQNGDLTYASYAVLSGDVWAGDDLNLNGYPVTFLRNVSVGDVIHNYSNGIFHGNVTQGADPIDLQMSVDLNYYENLAQGNISGEDTGIYQSSSSTIDFSLFDFSGSVPKYDGNNLTEDFNGVIYVDGDAWVKGTLEGGSITVIASDDIVIEDHVRAGNMATDWTQTHPTINFNSAKGIEQTETVSLDDIITANTTVVKLRTAGRKWNEMKMKLMEDGDVIGETYLVRRPGSPNEQMAVISNIELDPLEYSYSAKIYYKSRGVGANPTWVRAYTGDSVHIGLVAKDKVFIYSETPRQLIIDAALLARDNSWRALGYSSDHPSEYDSSWELTINGPIITAVGGSAGPWSYYGGTRNYNYDEDITSYPPPHFPVPLGGWQRLYWKEIKPDSV